MAANVAQQAALAVQGMVTTPLKEGSKIPANKLKEDDVTAATVNLSALSGKIIIVGVPGAFSSTCSNQAPGYIKNEQQFAEKGVKGIYVIAVNDAFVTQAWKEKLDGTSSKLVHFLADDTGAWSAAAGMTFDSVGFFGNRRSSRFSAIVEDGVVKHIWIEEDPTQIQTTGAENVLQSL